jgi:Raf kinase inhibitor-like YbhB/YbcL family protein
VKRSGLRILGLLLLIIAVLAAWVLLRRSASRKDIVDARTVPVLVVASSSFADGGTIPSKFTCDGGDVSPQISFTVPPAGTKSFALIVDDPDAPAGSFVHWVVFNLPATLRDLPEGASARAEIMQVAVQGKNDFDKNGYGGPCPPGSNPHHYSFRVYALDTTLELPEGSTKREVAQAATGHVVAEGKLIGLYKRGQ